MHIACMIVYKILLGVLDTGTLFYFSRVDFKAAINNELNLEI